MSSKNKVHLAVARGDAPAVVLLDQSAVFDTVDYSMLTDCLCSWLGDGGFVPDWFKSYLFDNSQCIKVVSILCDAKKLLYGVAKGLVLGAILFPYIYYIPQQSYSKLFWNKVSIFMQITHSYMFV